ncbi:MAG: MFS transporter [Thermovirga sp.]|nr:MFS transporter [Thermovirga sp.]
MTLISVLGVASVTPAFPTMIRALGVNQEDAAWLISAFTIPGLIFTPVVGLLSDRYGRKKVLIPCLFLFGAAGGTCFLVRNFGLLVFLRFLQGVGSAPLNVLNATLIGDLFKGDERPAALGYNTSVIGVGAALFPAFGGLLAMIGWNYPFLLALLAIPVGAWAYLGLDEGERFLEKNRPTEGSSSSLLGGLADKGIPLQRFITMMVFVIQFGGFITFLPFFLESGYGATPLTIGMISAAMSISGAVTSSRAGWLSTRFSGRSLMSAAFILYGSAFLFILRAPDCCGMIVPAVLFGVGQGINIPNLLTALTDRAPEGSRATVLSLNSMTLRLGQTLGPPLFGMIFASRGIEAVFITGAVMAVGMAVVVFWFLGGNKDRP